MIYKCKKCKRIQEDLTPQNCIFCGADKSQMKKYAHDRIDLINKYYEKDRRWTNKMNPDTFYSLIKMDHDKLMRIKKTLRNIMMTENYISMTDVVSLSNFIKELYPNMDIEELELKDLKIIGYRILLTR